MPARLQRTNFQILDSFPNTSERVVEDTMKDAEEFPPHENPEMKVKPIKRKVTQKLFPMFKEYLRTTAHKHLPPAERIEILNKGAHKSGC